MLVDVEVGEVGKSRIGEQSGIGGGSERQGRRPAAADILVPLVALVDNAVGGIIEDVRHAVQLPHLYRLDGSAVGGSEVHIAHIAFAVVEEVLFGTCAVHVLQDKSSLVANAEAEQDKVRVARIGDGGGFSPSSIHRGECPEVGEGGEVVAVCFLQAALAPGRNLAVVEVSVSVQIDIDSAAEGMEVAVLPREFACGIGGEVAVQHLHINGGLLGIRPAVDEVPRLEGDTVDKSAHFADVLHYLLHRPLQLGFKSFLDYDGSTLDDGRAVFGIEVVEGSDVDAGVGIGRGTGAFALYAAQQFRVRGLPRGGFVAVGCIEVSQLRRRENAST